MQHFFKTEILTFKKTYTGAKCTDIQAVFDF